MKTNLSRSLAAALAAVLLLGAAPGARAEPPAASGTPLNGTPAEVAKQYGPVLKHHARVRNHIVLEGTVLDGDLYGRNGLIIRAVYIKDRCVLLEYTRATGPLTADDVAAMLAANAGGSSWQQGKDSTDTARYYHRLDDRAIAHWSTENDGSLLVSVEDGGSPFDGVLLPQGQPETASPAPARKPGN